MNDAENGLDWQMKLTRLNQRGSHILTSGQWSDCSFVVGGEHSQETVKAHKLVLAMASPVFEAMFYGEMADKENKPIDILDVQPAAFKSILRYIYADEILIATLDQACAICYGAKKYMIPHLVESCINFIWKDLSPGNVCRAFVFARLFEEPNLEDRCLLIIKNRTEDVINDPSFEQVDANIIKTILQQETLDVNELVLWCAIVRWSKEECSRQSLESTPINQRKVLGDNIFLFRFLSMTPVQFANGPALTGILTQEESFNLLMNISSLGTTTVPDNFNLANKSRQPVPRPGPCRFTSSRQAMAALKENVQLQCNCTAEQRGMLANDQLVDCSLTFSVDRNVCIYGVIMPTQIRSKQSEQLGQPSTSSHRPLVSKYCELIYAFLQDSDACRLTYTHFTARVSWESTMEVLFNSPVYITPHKPYKIVIVLNRVGKYPMFENRWQVKVDGTTFTFVESSGNGLIKSLVFANEQSEGIVVSDWSY